MEYLYRYLKFNTRRKSLDWKDKRLERIFTHRELYFASPFKFNDPFDCKTLFSCEGSGDAEFKKFFEGKLKYDFPNLSDRAIEQKATALIRKGFHKDANWRRRHIEGFLRIMEAEIAKLGMLCLSEKRDDILMWSHYSDGHTGFCLEFEKEGLKIWNYCESVKYQNLYPTCKEFVNEIDSKTFYRMFLLRKSRHWKYEKEWRVIVNCENPANRILKYPDQLLTGVIWGCQMPKPYEDVILRWIAKRKNPLTLYRAYRKENKYSLKIQEI